MPLWLRKSPARRFHILIVVTDPSIPSAPAAAGIFYVSPFLNGVTK